MTCTYYDISFMSKPFMTNRNIEVDRGLKEVHDSVVTRRCQRVNLKCELR